MTPPSIIAIDGPAASGKSTLGLKLAQALGYLYFDTGVMYRAVTWQVLKLGVDPSDEAKVTALAEATQIEIAPASLEDGRVNDILIAGEPRILLIGSSGFHDVGSGLAEAERRVRRPGIGPPIDRGQSLYLAGPGGAVRQRRTQRGV